MDENPPRSRHRFPGVFSRSIDPDRTRSRRPITVADTKLTSKGRLPKDYQTPYGVATVRRDVYQSSRGGETFCPLDRAARIVVSPTPRFAKMVAHKYAEFGSARVIADIGETV
jgi:hypothetical protein